MRNDANLSNMNWTESKLGELISKVVDNRGKNPPYVSAGYEVIETGCISGNGKYPNYSAVKKYVDDQAYLNWFRSGHPKKDDLLIITVGNGIGSVSIMPSDRGVLTQNLIGLRFNDFSNSNFYYYYLNQKAVQDFLRSMNIGSAQPSLKVPHLLGLEVPVPPPEEQKTIASILSSLDNKIDLLHRQNKTLEALAETLFRQWFVEEAELSSSTILLGDIAIFSNGKSRPRKKLCGSIPIYGGNGILGYTDQSNSDGNNIIIGRVGAYCGSLFIENKPIWVSDNAMSVKPLNDSNHSYLFYLLKNLNLNEHAEGSSHPLLTQTLLKSIQINSPPKEKITEFCYQADKWIHKISFNKSQIKTLEKLRNSLLPKLMNGEVRVPINQ